MEGSSEDRWRSRRRRRLADLFADEPEEGEFVPGYHTGVNTEEYCNSPSCSSDSDATISDTAPANYGEASPSSGAANNNGAASSPPSAAAVFTCPSCGKEFRSKKAVCGHMKVHREQRIGKDEEVRRNMAAVGIRSGATGNRGCSGSIGRAAPPIAGTDQSMVVLAAESKIVLQPKPLAFAAPNLSPMANDSVGNTSPKPMNNDAMETVVGRAANPPTEAVVHVHAAPAAAPEDRQNPNGHTCKKCNRWFRTGQGLGGHMVGHKNRERRAAAVQDGAVPHRGNGKPEKTHVCKICSAEFAEGQQLGGHMRKHRSGPPLNKKPRFLVQPLPPPPSPRIPKPAVAGRVLLFGVDIGATAQTPAAAQEGSSVTQASASTSGKQ